MRPTTAAAAILFTMGTGGDEPAHFIPPAAAAAERIVANDNRAPAGTLRGGVLTIRLEARAGEWHPDGDADVGVQVRAFGEESKPLRIPAPLIRVPEGTEIRASVRNTFSDAPLILHGLHTRRGEPWPEPDTIHIPAGGAREIRFVAGVPGTYYYWATTTDVPLLAGRRAMDSQLSGAIVIDPRGVQSANRDRVFVIGFWGEPTNAPLDPSRLSRLVINGKAWPNTEPLEYTAGDSVRWRVINASALVHPMHLHGFYYQVMSRGGERVDSTFAPGSPPQLAVTERMGGFRTISLAWIPVRPGNWLFHCHDNVHIDRNVALPGAPTPPTGHAHVRNHAREMMGGLVMGVHVRPKGRPMATTEPAGARRLRLIARVDSGGTASEPAYGFALEERPRSGAPAPLLPGPTIVLTRGAPVAITVVNELPEATAIHWHGIELESYFDGVADYAGAPGRIAPAIAPRDSFEVRFTPPRAGTFMYHTHVDEVRQQKAGLSGALIVVEPGTTRDPATDLIFLITTPRLRENANVVYLNGSATPPALAMRAGTRYRMRLLNLHTFRPSMRFEVTRDSTLVMWRAVAKDGADLPSPLATERRASQQLGNGETYDFEMTPSAPGDLRIDVRTGVGVLLVSVPIHVR